LAFAAAACVLLAKSNGAHRDAVAVDNSKAGPSYVAEYGTAGSMVKADSDTVGASQKFKLEPQGEDGWLALKALSGGYLSRDNQKHFSVDCGHIGTDQLFKLIKHDDDDGVSLMDSTLHYITVLSHGSLVQGKATEMGDWESLKLVSNGDGTISLKSNQGKYISDPNGSRACDIQIDDAEKSYVHSRAREEAKPKTTTAKPTTTPFKPPPKAHFKKYYMYRAMNGDAYPMENVNTGNLAGVMWYIHNEVVATTPRKYGIMRVIRLEVKTAPPKALLEKGMHYGARFAYDGETCTGAGPWVGPPACSSQYDKYGYFLGCNNLNSYPFPMPMQGYPCYYPDAIWYALPKEGHCNCTEKYGKFMAHNYCDPTGEDDCTYSYKAAGEVSINDIAGITDYWTVANSGKWKEYDLGTDSGTDFHFWDGKFNKGRCAERLTKAREAFEKKYPDDDKEEDIPAPSCDFDCQQFYPDPPPQCDYNPYDLKCDSQASCVTVQHAYNGA
jgi:hypothetical protein